MSRLLPILFIFLLLLHFKQKLSYTWPGSNWRPSACEADVIATRPQVHENHAHCLKKLLCLEPNETTRRVSCCAFAANKQHEPFDIRRFRRTQNWLSARGVDISLDATTLRETFFWQTPICVARAMSGVGVWQRSTRNALLRTLWPNEQGVLRVLMRFYGALETRLQVRMLPTSQIDFCFRKS